MTTLYWILFVILVIIGFLGTVLPALPGLLFYFFAALLIYWGVPGVLSGWTVLVMFLGFLITFPIDLLGTVIGAKWGRATRWGLMGAGVGGFFGIFFGLPGLILGPIAGAFIAEIILQKRPLTEAAQAGAGAGAGFFLSIAAKVGLAIALIIVFVFDIFFLK